MSRAGINKYHVKEARAQLLEQGVHPSIDAVRVALGNTGSKSTIHRYLKELEAEEVVRVDPDTALSQPVKELIARLVERLKTDSEAIVQTAEEKHTTAIHSMKQQLEESSQQLAIARAQHEATQKKLHASQVDKEALSSALDACREQLEQCQQALVIARADASQKEALIASLEEKHQHNREALAHYRDSVKEQREQDARRNEEQIQHHQAEIRKLAQNLSIKQEETTRLNSDNARLSTELRETRKSREQMGCALEEKDGLLLAARDEQTRLQQALATGQTRLAEYTAEIEVLKSRYQSMQHTMEAATARVAQLETETRIRDAWAEQFTAMKALLEKKQTLEKKQPECSDNDVAEI